MLNNILYKSQGLECCLSFPVETFRNISFQTRDELLWHGGKTGQHSEGQSISSVNDFFFFLGPVTPAQCKVKAPEIKKSFYKSALTVFLLLAHKGFN